MSQFSRLWNRSPRPLRANTGGGSCLYSPQEWDSISRGAEWIALPFVKRQLSLRETRIGSAIVHYALASVAGAVYGTAGFLAPSMTKFRGMGFGIALWIVGDEMVMPVLGFTEKSSTYSLRMRANAFGEHLVYAFTVNLVYRRLTGLGESRP
ncbi:MAG: DUF1440 domain-containing protein [Candidatus Sulfotelmatobacter sp.]